MEVGAAGKIEASMTEEDGVAVDQIGALIYCHSNRRKDQSLRPKSDKSGAREKGVMNLDENYLSRPTTILTNCSMRRGPHVHPQSIGSLINCCTGALNTRDVA